MACKYCNFEREDVAPNVWSDSFKFGILGRLDIEGYISNCNKENKPVIEVQADICDTEDNSIDLGVKRVPIYFCPFCGRDLHKVEVKEELHGIFDLYQKEELATIIFNSLKRYGLTYLEDLKFLTRRGVSRIKGIGKKSLLYLDEVMKKYNVQYSTTDDLGVKLKLINVGDVISYVSSDNKTVKGTVMYINNKPDSVRYNSIRIETENGAYKIIFNVREIMSIKIIQPEVQSE